MLRSWGHSVGLNWNPLVSLLVGICLSFLSLLPGGLVQSTLCLSLSSPLGSVNPTHQEPSLLCWARDYVQHPRTLTNIKQVLSRLLLGPSYPCPPFWLEGSGCTMALRKTNRFGVTPPLWGSYSAVSLVGPHGDAIGELHGTPERWNSTHSSRA